MPQIISVVGKSGSGKTTLLEKLIAELKKRNYKIGVIKHALHGFDIDKKGKDSWRHGQAGADAVMVVAKEQLALIKKCDENELGLDSLVNYFSDMDLIITEGYKLSNKPKIEIFRKSVHKEPLCAIDNTLVAFVTDSNNYFNVPQFGLEEIGKLADFVENNFI